MKTSTSSVVTLSLLAGLVAATPTVLAQTAAETKFLLPASLPDGTKVNLGGSQTLEGINKGLLEGFGKKFPTATVTPTYNSSAEGIEAVAQGKADLAGIGRPLTKAEQAKGLGIKSLGFEKIAIIVSDQNPFANGNITLKQFGQIYRGEIRDWSQVKGPKGAIRVVDRPDTSDTRQAFGRYPIFASGIKTGSNVEKLTQDTAQSMADKLGKDGIGYVPVSQLKNLKGVKALSLHNTQPDNPKYPFSQPMSYAYSKDKVSEGAKALLGFIDTPEAAAAITAAGFTPAVAAGGTAPAPSVAASTSTAPSTDSGTTTGTTAGATDSNGGLPWWLLPLGLVGAGAGAWMLLGGKKDEQEETEPRRLNPLYPDDAPGTGTTGFGAGVKRGAADSSNPLSGDLSGTVTGTVNGAVDAVRDRSGDLLKGAGALGGAALAGGAAIAGGLGLGKGNDGGDQSATLSGELSGELPKIDVGNPLEGLRDKAAGLAGNVKLPDINLDNPIEGLTDKVGEIGGKIGEVGGSLTDNLPEIGNPLSGAVDKGSDLLKGLGIAGGAALAGGVAAAGGLFGKKDETETPDAPAAKAGGLDLGNPLEALKDKASDLLEGGKDMGGAALAGGAAIVGGTAAAANQGVQSFFGGNDEDQSGELSLESPDFETPISALNNPTVDPFDDSILSEPNAAMSGEEAAKFNPLEMLGDLKDSAVDKVQDLAGNSGTALAGGLAAAAGLAAGAGAAAKSFLNAEDQTPADAEPSGLLSEGQITLVSPNPAQAYVHWDVPVKLKRQLRQQGGKKLAVRMYDVTDLDISHSLPSNFQEFECDELAWDLHLPVPRADRQYLVEIGYVSESNSWLMLARSAPIWIKSSAS
jgi:phosphate transport system substrate-binding protein